MSIPANPVISYTETQNIEISPLEKPRVLIVGLSNAKTGLKENANTYGFDGVGEAYGETQHITSMLRESLGIIEASIARPQIDAYSFADTGFTAVVKKIAFTAWSKTEVLQLIAGEHTTFNKNLYELSIASGTTGANIATSLKDIINADTKRLVEATTNANELILTAKNKGIQGKDIQIFVKNIANITGGTVTVSETTPAAGEPDATAQAQLIEAIEGIRYNYIVYPFPTNTPLMNEVRSRIANGLVPNNELQDGILITGLNKTATDLITYSTNNIQTVRNPLVVIGNKLIDTTEAICGKYVASPSLLATKLATVLALATTHNSTPKNYFIQRSYGFPALAGNTALHNIIFDDILDSGYKGFSLTETNNLKNANISLLSKEGSYVVSGELYTLTTLGRYVMLQSEIQSQFFKEFAIKFLFYGDLTQDAETRTQLGRFIVDNIPDAQQRIKALCSTMFDYASGRLPYYEALSEIDYAILQNSDENKKTFMDMVEKTLKVMKNSQNQGQVFMNQILDGVFAINNIFITINKK